jgi:hypothetical protein
MATLQLTDSFPLTASATILDTSALGKSPSSVLHFLRSDVIGALDQTLDAVQIDTLAVAFNFQPEFSLAAGAAVFTAGGGVTGSLDLYKPVKTGSPNPLFLSDQFGSSIDIKRNCYLALGFQLTLKTAPTGQSGAYLVTPSAAVSGGAKLYLPFAAHAGGGYPTLKTALEAVCNAYSLPCSVAEMQTLPVGTVFVYATLGKLEFKASLDLLAVVNPTASLGAAQSARLINVKAGPAVTLGGGFSLTGDFEVRLWNKDGKIIQLGYYKKQGTTFTVAFKAGAGTDISAGGFDVIAKIYGLLGSEGKLDPAWVKANIPASVAAEVEEAYKAAVQTRLSIAIEEECDTTLSDQVAFSWSFNAEAMDEDGQSAFDAAIRGDLSRLMDSSALPAGVTRVGSVFDKLESDKHRFTFNFLGLFDHAGVEEASLRMTVKTSEDGQVVIADKATLSRLGATATPFVKTDLLRKVLVEDFVATVAYNTLLGHLATNIEVHYTYYDYLRHAHISDLATFVNTAAVLADAGDPKKDWAALLQSGISSQSASLLASLAYDNASAVRLFFDGAATARNAAAYEAVARQALVLTPGLGLHDAFVSFLKDDAKWRRLVDAGAPGSFYAVLGADQLDPPVWAKAAYAWTRHILTWAPAMHSAAQALQEVMDYAKSKPDLQPLSDSVFIQKRRTLGGLLRTAVQAAPLFHDALGIVTIRLAARPSSAMLNINYAGKTAAYS